MQEVKRREKMACVKLLKIEVYSVYCTCSTALSQGKELDFSGGPKTGSR